MTRLIAAALLCLAAQDGALREGVDASRVLFLGNSITRHGPAPKIGWNDDWGMAASAKEKDYVHLVAAGLEALSKKKPEIRFTNIADFERNLSTYDVAAKLKDDWAFKPTLVIDAIGENVADKDQFKPGLAKLLEAAKSSGANPTILVRSGFWADAVKDGILMDGCATVGGVWVDLSALGKDESNYARSERKFEHAGVAAHPGDKGMKAIADAILAALKK